MSPNLFGRPTAFFVITLSCVLWDSSAHAGAAPKGHSHHSAKPQKGVASYYLPTRLGPKMANGAAAKPGGLTAASKTLPLGAKAKVTNTETGKSVRVTVTDRGPYVKGRILDVSPKAADKLGMKHDGVAPVRVKPLRASGQKSR